MTAPGLWGDPGVPKRGWTCVDIKDLSPPGDYDYSDRNYPTCEMCEVATIRFVHTMRHPDYPRELEVGCVCAGHMEQSLKRAKEREAALKKHAASRKKWLTRKWRVSQKGNQYIRASGFLAVVFGQGKRWRFQVKEVETGRSSRWLDSYPSSQEAKLAAFDFIQRALQWSSQEKSRSI